MIYTAPCFSNFGLMVKLLKLRLVLVKGKMGIPGIAAQ